MTAMANIKPTLNYISEALFAMGLFSYGSQKRNTTASAWFVHL